MMHIFFYNFLFIYLKYKYIFYLLFNNILDNKMAKAGNTVPTKVLKTPKNTVRKTPKNTVRKTPKNVSNNEVSNKVETHYFSFKEHAYGRSILIRLYQAIRFLVKFRL